MNSKLIPILLIVVGGTMIYAGIQKQNPLTILKSVLTNTPVNVPVTTAGAPTNSDGSVDQINQKPNAAPQGQPPIPPNARI